MKDLPKRVRILGEDLVVFRSGRGEVGCLDLHCAHRGSSLEFGRIEAEGLRCCYHGWLYDTEGRVVDMPCEAAGFCERTAVEHPAYPVCSEISWCVPIDNEHITAFSIIAWPLENGEAKKNWRPRTDTILDIRPATIDRPYEERQRRPDDLEAQESQRAIAVHALETFGMSDMGIVALRKMLSEQLERVQRGEDPINVVRGTAAKAIIETHAWNTILSPEEAARHSGEDW